jgi:dUTP pyrophosphatase
MRVKLDKDAYMPVRAHQDDAGMDLRTPFDVTVLPNGCSAVIDTGVHMEIPKGYFGKVESKSGLNVNHGAVSCGGVIDCGYTGSIVVKLYNFGKLPYHFKKGDKVAQLVIIPCIAPELEQVEELSTDSERGNNGFGSTGR